jgi:hypothetical protein
MGGDDGEYFRPAQPGPAEEAEHRQDKGQIGCPIARRCEVGLDEEDEQAGVDGRELASAIEKKRLPGNDR